MRRGRHEEAIKGFTVVLTREPNNVRALYNRAISYMNLADRATGCAAKLPQLRPAERDLSAVVKLQPDYPRAKENLPKVQDSIAECTATTIGTVRRDGPAYDDAVQAMKRGNHEQAVKGFTIVLRREPNNVRALYNRAISYMNLADRATACAANVKAK
jgi:Flp pilus assembly protein TadD